MENFINTIFYSNNKIKYSTRKYKKNEIVKSQGDLCEWLIFINKGELTINTYTLSESDFTIKKAKAGDFIGLSLLFSNNQRYLGNIICTKDCELFFIKKNILLNYLSNNQAVLSTFLELISNNALMFQKRAKILLQNNIRNKILFYIEENLDNNSKSVYFDSKENLSKYLNVPRPSLSRELMKMKDDGIIEYNKHFIVLKKITKEN